MHFQHNFTISQYKSSSTGAGADEIHHSQMALEFHTSPRTNEISRASRRPPTVGRRSSNRFFSLAARNPQRVAQLSVKKKGNGGSVNENIVVVNSYRNGAISDVDGDCGGSIWEEIEHVEVFAIGSRKDAVLDFCLNSPYLSPALRFWNILVEDSSNVQLQQRLSNRDTAARIVEAPSVLKPCSKAVILVASAAYGSDDKAALNILQRIKSANGFTIGLILKPFSFEGRRRQDEATHLVDKLQKDSNFCISVDTDALLKKDTVTFDEALKTSNNAVLMAINAISILISERHKKLLEVPEKGIKELKTPEIQKILENYRFARIGFGTGHSIESSISRAVYDCPFLGKGVKIGIAIANVIMSTVDVGIVIADRVRLHLVKDFTGTCMDFNGTIVCIVASSGNIKENDANSILHAVRLITECKTQILLSIIHDTILESNLVMTTIITSGSEQESSQKNNIFSKLADHIPFIFNILKQHPQQPDHMESFVCETPYFPKLSFNLDNNDVVHKNSLYLDDTSGVIVSYTEEVEPLSDNVDEVLSSKRNENNNREEIPDEFSDSNSYPSIHAPNAKGVATFEEQLLTRYRLGPDNQNINEWAKEGDASTEATLLLDSVNFYTLPVGVKRSEHLNESYPYTMSQNKWRAEDYRKPDFKQSASWKGLSDWGFEALDPTNILSSKTGSYFGDSNKQQLLSARAASMLEAERVSDKKWSPIVEMGYRGGIYRGRIQGGLPEGKGRLSLENGGIYDGMWRYGKRSGMGSFYYSNGDVYQGSWRDDAMHGKGWLYFHTGDRWFVNFWKGKANGEGRFYSTLGDIFFGHFKNGWRHGHFLCIGVDGTRFHEVWEEGVLVSREQLDPNADAA